MFDEIAITRVIDFASRGIRSSVFLPLYPLAEWLATHWWFLFYEVETLGRSTSDQYDRRHNLRYGAEGFAVPSLTIQPLGEQIKLEWRRARLDAQNLELTESGSAQVFARELRQTLCDFISAVLRRLQELGVEGTLLEEEWRSIQAVDPEERDFCSAVASLGLDPYTLDEGQQQKVLDVSELLPASLLGDFFAVADFSTLSLQASQLTMPAGQPLIVTRARSERQKRNRAFAAEFLVPADLLREALPGPVVGDEDIDALAAGFGVSPSVIRHQIENHGLARALPD